MGTNYEMHFFSSLVHYLEDLIWIHALSLFGDGLKVLIINKLRLFVFHDLFCLICQDHVKVMVLRLCIYHCVKCLFAILQGTLLLAFCSKCLARLTIMIFTENIKV